MKPKFKKLAIGLLSFSLPNTCPARIYVPIFCIVLGSNSFEFLTVSLHHFLTAYPLRPFQISMTTNFIQMFP